MTVEQHLWMAGYLGTEAESWAHPSQGNHQRARHMAELMAVGAAHHALLAQKCRYCGGTGWGEYDEPTDKCHGCEGRGWNPRAASL